MGNQKSAAIMTIMKPMTSIASHESRAGMASNLTGSASPLDTACACEVILVRSPSDGRDVSPWSRFFKEKKAVVGPILFQPIWGILQKPILQDILSHCRGLASEIIQDAESF